MPTTSRDTVLWTVKFDERLPKYWLLVSSIIIASTFIGIPFLLFWWLGLGIYIHRRQYRALEAELTGRSLNIRKGVLFRVQKNIPLDKITDLAVNEGPILRMLGLCSLGLETAGGGANTAMGQAHLPGVVDAVAFRDAVLDQRDRVTEIGAGAAAPPPLPPSQAAGEPGSSATLVEIRDSLGRIEGLLERNLEAREQGLKKG